MADSQANPENESRRTEPVEPTEVPADPAPSADQQAEPIAEEPAAESTPMVETFQSDALDEAGETAEAATEEAPSESAPVESEAGDTVGADEPMVTPGMNWFVLRVASNKEDSVRETLLRKIKIEGFEHLVNRILVPTEKIRTMKGGKQKITERKLYPGYVFVEMQLEHDGRIPQDVFFLIKETTGVGDFIGTAGRPAPMQPHEVEKMILASRRPEEEPEVKMEFAPGDAVKIKEGPFENMEGTVDTLIPEQGKVRVIVNIFGRATPVELEYWLVEKPEE